MVKRKKADFDYHQDSFVVQDDGKGPNSLAHPPSQWQKRSVRDPGPTQWPRSEQLSSNADQGHSSRPPYKKMRPSGSAQGGTPGPHAVRTPQSNTRLLNNSKRQRETHRLSSATPKMSPSKVGSNRGELGPMRRRMGCSSTATKLTAGERMRMANQLKSGATDSPEQVLAAIERKRLEREQFRQRRKAEQQQQLARTIMASRRCNDYSVIDLTQTDDELELKQTSKEGKLEMVSSDEDEDDLLRALGNKYRNLSPQKRLKVAHPESPAPGEAQQTAPQPISALPSACKEKENVILLLSDDEQPSRLKKPRATRLYALPKSDPTFAPPNSDTGERKGKVQKVTKSVPKRKRSPLRQIGDILDSGISRIENSRKETHTAKEDDVLKEKKALDLMISSVRAYPKEIKTKVDGVIVLSDEESPVQVVKDTPLKSGMKRVTEKRSIPAQSFYGRKKEPNGGTVGKIHFPGLKPKAQVDHLPGEVIPLEPSDDEDDDVIECEPVAKLGRHEIMDDFEMPDIYIKEEPPFEPDSKRAHDVRFRPLTLEEQTLVNSLSNRVPKQLVLATIREANIGLKGEDFGCLRGSRWLNDEILNSFVALINSRNIRDVRSEAKFNSDELDVGKAYSIDVDAPQDDTHEIFSRKRPRTHVFNTFFFPRLTQKGYDYSGVTRWLKRAGLSVLSLDLILIPINLKNFHWVLTAIDLRSKQFLYLDSTYGKDTSNTIPMLKKWLFDEVKDKHGTEAAENLGINFWRVHINPSYLPRQQDGGSCGIFTLYMADYLERGLCPNFTQRDIRNLRRRTALFLRDGILPN